MDEIHQLWNTIHTSFNYIKDFYTRGYPDINMISTFQGFAR